MSPIFNDFSEYEGAISVSGIANTVACHYRTYLSRSLLFITLCIRIMIDVGLGMNLRTVVVIPENIEAVRLLIM